MSARPTHRAGLLLVGRKADPRAEMFRQLAAELVPYVRELLEAERCDADFVDVAAFVPLPRRMVFRACRSGQIVGAVRKGRRWLASRGAVDAWLLSKGPHAIPYAEGDGLDHLREALAQPEKPRKRRCR